MGEDNFLKQAGGFLIAFLLGSATLHGILYYLVTDAGDLFFANGDTSWPLILFLILYPLIPFLILFIWRFKLVSTKLKSAYDQQDTNVKQFTILEQFAFAGLFVGLLFYAAYIFIMLVSNKIEPLYIIAIVVALISFLLILITIFYLSKIKTKEPDLNENHANDELAKKEKFTFRIEFIGLMIAWVGLSCYIAYSFSPPINSKNEVQDSSPVGTDLDTNINVKQRLFESKALLNFVNSGIQDLGDIESKFLLSHFSTDKNVNNVDFETLFHNYKNSFATNLEAYKNEVDTSTKQYSNYPKPDSDTLKKILKHPINRSDIGEFNFWMSVTKNSLLAQKKEYEDKLVSTVFFVLVKSQFYLLIQFLILLFLALVYWHASNMAFLQSLHNANSEEVPSAPSEIEASKGLLVLVFVFIVPILKPLKMESIQFHRPLWTANIASITNISNPSPMPTTDPVPPISIIYRTDTVISNSEFDIEKLKGVRDSLHIIHQLIRDADDSERLDRIERKVNEVEAELNRSKKR